MSQLELSEFIHRLPKTETHLHIEGALPYELLQRLDAEAYAEPQACWAPDFKWSCFEEFERHLLEHATKWFTSAAHYHEAARLIFRKHLEQNVRYVETSFHAGIIEFLKIPGREILAAIQSAVPPGLEVRVFLGMARNSHNPALGPVLEDCLNWEGLAGIDLHGVEYLPLEDWIPRLWSRARAAGLETKAHAGEFGPSGHVREALELLGTRRIQHGIRAVEDPEVLQLAIDLGATFDVCPISNLKLGVIESMPQHPIREFYDRGLRCTISTDDPFSFGNSLEDEYRALASELGFTHEELARLAKNGFEVALVDGAQRESWMAEVDALLPTLPTLPTRPV